MQVSSWNITKPNCFILHKLDIFPTPIDLSSIGGPIISPKSIWQYLGFYFDWKLNFNYHIHFYATKCMSTLNAMKMLGNSLRGLLPIQKRLLYRTCILSIALYGFQLWFFKGVLTLKNINKLKKMQRQATLWITSAFHTLPSEGIKAITGLIPITLHLQKLNGRHHLWHAFIPIREHLVYHLVSPVSSYLLRVLYLFIYHVPIIPYFSCLCHVVRCLLFYFRTIVITDPCAYDCPWDHLV